MAGALEGIKVLDLSRILAGPWAAQSLGELGAEIWKVEHPDGGDDTRSWAPPAKNGVTTYYLSANRNKKSIAVDIGTQQGRDIVLDLARKADVVVENFRPSSLEKLGLTYEALKTVNPRLIHCSISGYGRASEYASRPGYDFVLQAETGFMSITGEVEGNPMRLGVAFIDLVTGMNAGSAILAALYARERTGEGQHLDIALHHSGLYLLANVASGHLNMGTEPHRYGNAHPSIVPYQLFDTSDDQIALAVGNDGQFRRLCSDVLGDDTLAADPRFSTNVDRVANRVVLIEILSRAFAARTTADLMAAMDLAGIPVGKVNTVSQAFASPETEARHAVVKIPHPIIGEMRAVASPYVMSRTPVVEPVAPPLLGQHTRSILSEVLGWDEARLASALNDGIVGEAMEGSV
jgi:crotonobetainyl-CoA:carnitine CoA-transferase CaiB-like acyl-CoA transferase